LSRLATLDKALVLILVPLWVFSFALTVRTQLAGGGYAYIGLSAADAESYPVLNGDFSSEYPSNPLEEAGLRAGDLLVRAGGADLRGIGKLAFVAIVREEAGQDLDVRVVYEREGKRRETSLGLVPISLFLPMLGFSFSFAASALFLRLRARTTRSVRAYFLAAFSFAIATCFFDPVYANAVILPVASGLYLPLMLRFAQVFPDDVAPEGRWHRIWPWLFIVLGPFMVLFFAGRYTLAIAGFAGTLVLGLATVLAVFTRKYRRLDPVARRQMKWVLFGAYCALLPGVIVLAITLFEPRFLPLIYLCAWAAAILPAALVVSVVRFNLFDVDRLLSAAASYNVVLVVLGAGALVVVPRAAEAASGLLGIDPGTGQVALSLLLVGVVIPAHRRLRPQIDRLFFKDRYALDHGIAELLPTLSTCADARELTERVGEELNRLLRPGVCVVYAGVEQSYVPVFVEGRAVPPAFEAARESRIIQ